MELVLEDFLNKYQDQAEREGDYKRSLKVNWIRAAISSSQIDEQKIYQKIIDIHYGNRP